MNGVVWLQNAWISLNNPGQLNGYTTEALKEIILAFRQASMDRSVVCVVFMAVGDQAFCTGGNTKEYGEYYAGNPQEYKQYMRLFNDMLDAILCCDKPVVNRVNGMRVGGGQEIEMACDFSIAADTARFAQAGPRHGSAPDGGSTDFLPLYVGFSRAMESGVLCEMWSANLRSFKERTMDKEKVRLLVADDEESIRGTLSALLGDEGYDVTAVPSAEEALGRFGSDPFPLVITDIRMGGMSGIDLLKEVRTIRPETEVIIITSYASLDTAVLALRSGAYEYLIKPFEELDLVVAAVARALEKSRLVREKMALIEALARKNDELQQVNRILAESVNRDGLTGLYNHRYFQEAANRELCLALRHDRAFSLLFKRLSPTPWVDWKFWSKDHKPNWRYLLKF